MNLFSGDTFAFFHPMTQYLGVDMAAESLVVAFDERETAAFTNDASGFKQLLSRIAPDAVFGVEATGNYHHEFAVFFLQRGFAVREINPLITKQQLKCTVRNRKTDVTDALLIRRILLFAEGHPLSLPALVADAGALKKLTRARRQLIGIRSAMKTKLHSYGRDVCDTAFLQTTCTALITDVSTQIERVETEIARYRTPDRAILESVTGISTVLSAVIMAEIGDLSRFASAKKLVAFAGLDPKVRQSGKCLNSAGKLTKRGSASLRHALFLAARSNICSDTVFTRYYQKQRDKGKTYTQAVSATARKMLEIIYMLLSKQVMFDRSFTAAKAELA